MGAFPYLSTSSPSTKTTGPPAADTSAMHNASVDEVAARQGACAQVHLPTGRMCLLPHGHRGSCHFVSADDAYASLPRHRSHQRR